MTPEPFQVHVVKCLKRIRKIGYAAFIAEELEKPSWNDYEWSQFIVREANRLDQGEPLQPPAKVLPFRPGERETKQAGELDPLAPTDLP